jgi:hypothetical protein
MVSLLRPLLVLALTSSLGCGRLDLKRRDGGNAAPTDAAIANTQDVLPFTPAAEVGPDGDRDTADGPEANGTPDGSPDGNPDIAAAKPCVGPLPATSAYCPPSFDDVAARTATCMMYETIDVGECAADGLLMFTRSFGIYGDECFYDPQSRALVAERFWNDTPVCDGGWSMIYVAEGMSADFCGTTCGDGCTDRFTRLERYADCCRSWPFPIPGCPADGGAVDALDATADRLPTPPSL